MRARWVLGAGAGVTGAGMLLSGSNAWGAWVLLLVLVGVLIVLEVVDEVRATRAERRAALAAEVERAVARGERIR